MIQHIDTFFRRKRMKGLKRNLLGILILCIPILLQGAVFEVKVIKSAADLPEQFNTLWKEGDVLVSDGKNMVLFGGTDRILRSYYQYPIEHTLGSVLGYVPKGKGIKSDLVIGSPYIRIKNKSQYLSYSSFSAIPQKAQDGSLLFLAAAHYKGDKGEKAEIKTLYHLNPESGKIDITSTVKAPGEQILKFQDKISLNIKHDSYIIIEVLGNKTLFPVIQKRLKKDGYKCGPLPYALTNPIFVDVDGNGKFDSPLPKIKFIF